MLNWAGLAGIIVFYLLILAVGLWAAWRRKRGRSEAAANEQDEVMLAGRDIGLFVGILSMTASWVGGGYINGTAEEIFKSGLVWTQAPIGYSIGLLLSGRFYARPMRERGYTTIIDPLQERLGRVMGGLLYIPALLGEILYSASILGALASTINVILQLDKYVSYGDNLSIIISAVIAVVYTLFGGLISVTYTDVVQLFFIFVGLWFSLPFAMTHEAFSTLEVSQNDWVGTLDPHFAGVWVDFAFLVLVGGIPWQSLYQRVLSAKSPRRAQKLVYAAALGCVFLATPAILIGAIAKGTDWEKTEHGKKPEGSETRFILPLVMQYLTPGWVAFIGLGAVSAAVMSSADSSVLSCSTMFARNIYHRLIRPQASDREVIIVLRIGILVCATTSTVIAIVVKSIYGLFVLCADLVYVILFPQFSIVVHFPRLVNTYGSALGFAVGLILRLGGGEPLLGLDPVIKYWWYNEEDGQLFPFRTFSMVCSCLTLVVSSLAIERLFTSGTIPQQYDVARCFTESQEDEPQVLKISKRDNEHKTGIDNPASVDDVTGL